MKTLRFNITKPKKYVGRDGQEKTQWNNVGTLTEFHRDDGSIGRLVEIPVIGLEAQAFPIEPKSPNPYAGRPRLTAEPVENAAQSAELDAGAEIDPNNLPF